MEQRKLLGVWFKYQLSLNWLNILFRYSVKLLLLLNLSIVVVGVTYKYKSAASQFVFLITGLVLIDLLLKINLKKSRQDIQAFHVVPNGIHFLSTLNTLQDIFSPRNLILPLLTMVVATIVGLQTEHSFAYLFLMSCVNNTIAGFIDNRKKTIAVVTTIALIWVTSSFQLSAMLTNALAGLALLLFIYLRYGEKPYLEQNTLSARAPSAIYNINNPFLWLDFQILRKSRHLQLTFVKVLAVCLLYCYLISEKYGHQAESEFDLILLIQIYYSLAPVFLIPYILSSNYSYIGLLMTLPDLKSFFMTKLNIILLFQFLLTLILYGLNYNNVQTLFLISSICIFNLFVVTPIMFMGILLTDEKVNVFDSGIKNLLLVPPFAQSIYFFVVMVLACATLYFLRYLGLNNFSWILIGLSTGAFLQRKKLIAFFHSQYNRRKYRLFNILS